MIHKNIIIIILLYIFSFFIILNSYAGELYSGETLNIYTIETVTKYLGKRITISYKENEQLRLINLHIIGILVEYKFNEIKCYSLIGKTEKQNRVLIDIKTITNI